MKKESCHKCGKEMKLITEKFDGILCDSYKCPKCKTSIFTEEQALAFGRMYQRRFLKENYKKKPVKIGNSYGIIFPRDIVKVFNLDSGKTTLDVRMDKAKNKIEITVN